MNGLAKLLGVDSEEYNHWQLHWSPEDPVVLTVLGIVIPLGLWFFWTSLNRVGSRSRKFLLFALRLSAFTLLLLVLLKPELEFRKSQSLKNSIAVLLDNSKSLSIKTKIDESSRIDLIKKALQANASYFENLAKDFNVDYYFFSDDIDMRIFIFSDSIRFGELSTQVRMITLMIIIMMKYRYIDMN